MPGLNFAVANANGAPVVYIADENTLTLTVTNQTGAPLTLKGGTPVAEDALGAASDPTSLYLTFGNLLDAFQLKNLHVSATGWKASFFSDDTLTNWALAPVSDMVLPDQGTVAVTIANMPVSGSPGSAPLSVDYVNFPTVDDDSFQQTLMVQRPPSQLRDLVLDAEIVGSNVVYVSRGATNPIVNTLVLAVVNSSRDTPIVPPTVSPGEQAPTFSLYFTYGTKHGYGALTTTDLGQQFHVNAMEQTEDTWQPQKEVEDAGPFWTLTPKQPEILGTGTAGRVAFIISNVVTTFEPETLPTPLFLQWKNIPGYDDGYLSLDLYKALPIPGILSFHALTPEIITAGNPVLLTWQTFAVARVQLSYMVTERTAGAATPSEQEIVFDSRTGQIALSMEQFAPTPIPLSGTTFNLDAFDARGAKIDSRQIVLTVNDPPLTFGPFTASPSIANFEGGPVDVTLSWSVSPAQLVKNLEIEDVGDVTGLTSYVVRGVQIAGRFVLRATSLDDNAYETSLQTRSLADYLVGRGYQVINEAVVVDAMDNSKGYYSRTEDRLEILSRSQACYTVTTTGTVQVPVPPGKPAQTPRPADGFPRTLTGGWTLNGSTIEVATSQGTMQFDYEPQSPKGEALRLRIPPYDQGSLPRWDYWMTPM